MRTALFVVGGLLVLGLVLGGQLMGSRNDLVQQRESVEGAWANVDVALQRRADLIPNLVATVQGYAKQEKEVYASIAEARAKLAGAGNTRDKIAANGQLDQALARLLVVVESYPQLKSNENFLRLQDELAGTENRVAVERNKYNETVKKYNTSIDLFPSNIAAGMFGFQRNDNYFKTDPASRQAPKVDFSK